MLISILELIVLSASCYSLGSRMRVYESNMKRRRGLLGTKGVPQMEIWYPRKGWKI